MRELIFLLAGVAIGALAGLIRRPVRHQRRPWPQNRNGEGYAGGYWIAGRFYPPGSPGVRAEDLPGRVLEAHPAAGRAAAD